MASTPTGAGYWLVASDGGVFAFGDARFFGSTGAIRLNRPVVGMASTPTGNGYWLVASDGGIFAFGDAQFHGSTGRLRLNSPVVAMEATREGTGYWLVARDGGVFSFNVDFAGSVPGLGLASYAGSAALRSTLNGLAYYVLGADGGVFTFGPARFFGSRPGLSGPTAAVDLAVVDRPLPPG
jgi:ribosomal protein L24E